MDLNSATTNSIGSVTTDKYGIHCCPSTTYNHAANGLAEAFNKTICKILKKIVSNNKKS